MSSIFERRFVRISLFLLVLTGLGTGGYVYWPVIQQFLSAQKPVATPPRPALVEVTPLEVTDFELREPVAGLLEPSRETTLAFETGGQVAEVLVDLGDEVNEGQPLIRLNTELLETALEQARLDAELAEKNLSRIRQLREQGVSTQEEFDQVQTQAQLGLQREREAQVRLDRAVLTSPFAGRVREVYVEVKEYVSPGAPAVELLDLTPMELSVTVPETEIAGIEPGDLVRLNLRALGPGYREATVSRVAPGPVNEAPLFEVEIDMPNDDGKLIAGLLGTGYVITGIVEDVWAIPLEALIIRRGQTAVMVAIDRRARLLPLPDDFRKNRGFALVPAGFWPDMPQPDGLPLITRGHKALRTGAPVEIYEENLPEDLEPRPLEKLEPAPQQAEL